MIMMTISTTHDHLMIAHAPRLVLLSLGSLAFYDEKDIQRKTFIPNSHSSSKQDLSRPRPASDKNISR
jgi:hypothetical protein